MKLKKGDTVKVIAGKDKGQQGEIVHVFPSDNKVLVNGINTAKKHSKARRANQPAGIIDRDMPVHVSNVMLVVEVDGKKVGSRVGYRVEKVERDGHEKTVRVRYAKRTGEDI